MPFLLPRTQVLIPLCVDGVLQQPQALIHQVLFCVVDNVLMQHASIFFGVVPSVFLLNMFKWQICSHKDNVFDLIKKQYHVLCSNTSRSIFFP
jgi:hypothetical protein